MLWRKRISSSVSVVRGVGTGVCSVVSDIRIPSRRNNRPWILAPLDWSGVAKRSAAPRAKRSAAPRMHQLKCVRLQNALDLITRMDRPRARGVELDVGLPVFQRLARIAGFFVGEREVVVCVGIGRS